MHTWLRWLQGLWQRWQGAESASDEPTPHARSAQERARFWAEFRAGQREADKRMLETPNPPHPATR